MKLTPLKVSLLMHYHCISEQYHHPSRAVDEATIEFLENDLIMESDSPSGYSTTVKGDYYIGMILNTPQPTQLWVDPRNRKEIK